VVDNLGQGEVNKVLDVVVHKLPDNVAVRGVQAREHLVQTLHHGDVLHQGKSLLGVVVVPHHLLVVRGLLRALRVRVRVRGLVELEGALETEERGEPSAPTKAETKTKRQTCSRMRLVRSEARRAPRCRTLKRLLA